MSRNREIAVAFGGQLVPPRTPVQVQRINGAPHRDAWMVAAFDEAVQVGITAHVYGGQLHAFIEVMAGPDQAARVGTLLAATMQALKDGQQAGDGSQGQPGLGSTEGHAE